MCILGAIFCHQDHWFLLALGVQPIAVGIFNSRRIHIENGLDAFIPQHKESCAIFQLVYMYFHLIGQRKFRAK